MSGEAPSVSKKFAASTHPSDQQTPDPEPKPQENPHFHREGSFDKANTDSTLHMNKPRYNPCFH